MNISDQTEILEVWFGLKKKKINYLSKPPGLIENATASGLRKRKTL